MSNGFKFIGGYASIVAGCLLFFGHSLNLRGGLEFGTVTGSTCVFVAHLLLAFALMALYSCNEQGGKVLGLLGMILGVVGTIATTAVVYVEISGASGVTVSPVYASGVPAIIHSILPLLFVLGLILFGISVIRLNNLPHVGGYLLIVGTIVFVAASFLGSAQAAGDVIGSLITGAGFVWLGIPLVARR